MWIRRAVYMLVVAGTALSLTACSSDEDNYASPVVPGPGGGGSGQAPMITKITWTHGPGCAFGVATPVTVQVDVTDTDTDLSQLTYSGSVSSCGAINSATTQVTCPQVGQYSGTVTVSDPEGNSDTMNFSFGPCQDGEVP